MKKTLASDDFAASGAVRSQAEQAFKRHPRVSTQLSQVSAFPVRQPGVDTNCREAEALVARWLEKLLQHFGIRELDSSSDGRLADLLACCGERDIAAVEDGELLADLRRRIVRLAGAQLGDAFITMSSDVLDEADLETIFLSVEGRQLQGVRWQGEIYRLLEVFDPCHRLQAFCLAQTLKEQETSYLIARACKRFSVWVNVRSLPQRSYRKHLPSGRSLLS